ncbi:uncharacterized protein KIAA2012 homolog isoform X3 [Ascaphus truei]|uniref:uncharacterized protein KIAA2012 homolog isoform X3 n=1 Tax=Ascaphus truei TaxID=8439 RepID=UPI003F593987
MSTLSLLSRGNAQVVNTSHKKLEVRYEPEDYFNWKSRQLFHTRRFLNGGNTAHSSWEALPPKTYSTRKGALVLYSEDLALPSWHGTRDRLINRSHRHKRKRFKLELNTLQDLTGAILAYGRKQVKKGQTDTRWQPYLHFFHEEENQSDRQIRPGYSPKRYLSHLFQTWDPNIVYRLQQAGSLRDPVQLQQPTTNAAENCRRHQDLSSVPLKYHCLPVFTSPYLPHWIQTDVLTTSGRCTPVQEELENEEDLGYDVVACEVYVKKKSALPATGRVTLRKPSPETVEPCGREIPWKKGYSREIWDTRKGELLENHQGEDDLTSERAEHPEKPPASVAVSLGKGSVALFHRQPHMTFYGGPLAGRKKFQHGKQDYFKQHYEKEEALPEVGLFPPVLQSLDSEHGFGRELHTKQVQESLKLPPILEASAPAPPCKRRLHASDPPKELLIIPLLIHFQSQQVNREETTRPGEPPTGEFVRQSTTTEPVLPTLDDEATMPMPEGRIKALLMDIDWNVNAHAGSSSLLHVGHRKPVLEWRKAGRRGVKAADAKIDGDLLPMPEAPPLGSLPPINGKKGPGNQSSMANLKVPNVSSSTTSGSKGLPTGIIRGSLPEELKECCKGSSVGSLIMSPNGEIVCLSLMGSVRDTNIPIRFDFIPEEDCLPLESEGQGEQCPENQQTSVQGADGSNSSSLNIPRNAEEASTTSQHRKEKKRHQNLTKPNLHEDDSKFAPDSEKALPSTDEATTSPLIIPGSTPSSDRTSRSKDQHPTATDEELKHSGSSGRFSPRRDQLKMSTLFQDTEEIVSGSLDSEERSTVPQESRRENQTVRHSQQHKTDPSESRPEFQSDTLHGNGAFYGQEPLKHEIETEQLQDNVTTAPSSGQGEQSTKQEAQSTKGPGRQQSNKQKKSETTVKGNPQSSGQSMEIIDKVPSDQREQKLPIVLPEAQRDAGRDMSHSLKQPMTEEEEMAVLQEIATSTKKDTPKTKGKKKTKTVKAENLGKTPAPGEIKANQEGGGKQGRAAFVVGQPKENKLQGKTSTYPKKNSGVVQRQEAVEEITDADCEEEEKPTKQSDTHSVLEETEEVTPTPTPSEDPHSDPDVEMPSMDSEIASQGVEQLAPVDRTVLGIPYVAISVTHVSEDDNTNSEISEAPSGSLHQHKSSRARVLSEKAEKRRIEVEKKRRELEEQLRLQQEEQERMENMKEELENEQLRRAQEIRRKKEQQEEEKQHREQEETRKIQLQQLVLERARHQQEEYRKKLQELQRQKQQEERERIATERQRQKEQERMETEERRRLLEMADDEREEYRRKKQEQEEQTRSEAEERRHIAEAAAKSAMEEAQRRAQLLARQQAALELQLQFNRGLMNESVGLDQYQAISRPWVFSYFEFLELLGLPTPPMEGE